MCASPSVTLTNPASPTSNLACTENVACSLSVGTYSPSTSGCTFTYSIIDTTTLAATTLGFALTDNSNTITLDLTAAIGTAGTYNLKIEGSTSGVIKNDLYTFTVVIS